MVAASSKTSSIRDAWESAARLILDNRDVLDARPANGDPPDALVARGWSTFLLALSEEQLTELEIGGQAAGWPRNVPRSLLALVEAARHVCALPSLPAPALSSSTARPARRLETPRKREQVEVFARVILPLAARASRVVDVGSGHGHLTREIAERIALPVVGLERDLDLAGRARTLSASPAIAAPSFAVTDVLRDGLALSVGDCVVGLHACGELGDAMVESVALCRDSSLALVGCCLQKRRGSSRPPLCRSAVTTETAAALDLPTRLLGLSNLAAGDLGVEATRVENLAARERRLALHRLLSDLDGPLRFGAEIDGLNRRAAQHDLPTLVARAFALRSRPSPSRRAIDDAALWARTHHGHARRLAVPRAMLARVLEVFVLLDRALFLQEHDLEVVIGSLFPISVSARNLGLLAFRGA